MLVKPNVKEYGQGKKSRFEIQETVENLFGALDLSSDTIGGRTYHAVWLLGELRVSSALARLLPLVNHPILSVHNALAEALGKIGEVESIGDDGLAALRTLLSDPYYRTRIHAAEAIRKVHATSLLSDLKRALEREPLPDVREEMSRAIRFLEG